MSILNQTMVSLEAVTVRLHGEIVFQNINFEIEKGEHWALTGNDEKGRSTLLETIAGKLPIAAGNVIYPFLAQFQRENPVQSPPASWHKSISLVSSRHNFSSLSRTEEQFYQQRYNATAADDSPTVAEHLAEVKSYTDNPIWMFGKTVAALNLHHLLDRRLIKLSNGETRRVLLAEALLRNPAILLLENPLVGLDVGMRQELNKLITAVAESGITLVMVTAPGEMPDAITHIAVWDKGQKMQVMPKRAFCSGESPSHRQGKADITEIQALLAEPVPASFDTVVSMENVTVQYGEKTVLDNINWTVKQGERWALVGHNGAGKTTLLSLINADNPQAYANKVTLFDRRRGSGESIWDIKQHIGFVSPELFQYFPGRQLCEQVIESGFYDAVGLNRESQPAKQARVLRWMQLLQIEGLVGKPFRQVPVSGQRLCLLARALVKNPPLLILDEPCQGFDASQQAQFKGLVDAICASSNITLIYVSHYQHEIPNSVRHIMHLENGKARIEAL